MNKTPRIHVFRAGQHRTSAGESIEFSQADLAASAAAYDPTIHEAPLVVGHPKTDDPAYGWVKSLVAEGSNLYADAEIHPEFAEMIRAGAYKNRSMKWYRPDDAGNPKPGVWYAQHVGFLGAVPPAIKGLRPVELAQTANPVEVEFSADDPSAPDLPVSPHSKEEALVTPEEKAALEAENAKLKARLADVEAREAASRAAARLTSAAQFCEALIGEGRVLPAEKDTVTGLLVMTSELQPVEFGEGDGKAVEAPLTRLQAFLKGLPPRVTFREVVPGKTKTGAPVEFAAPPGMSVDAERLDLHHRASAWLSEHPDADYLAAVKAVS